MPAEEFRRVLENAPAGVFTQEAWESGMNSSEYPRHRYRGAGFLMARLVRRLGVSLVGSGGGRGEAAMPATPLTRFE